MSSIEWRSPGSRALVTVARGLRLVQRAPAAWDSIRSRLVLVAMVATAPLLLLVALNAAEDLRAARQDAQSEALRVAQLQANLVDEYLQGVDTLLRGVAQQLASEPLDDPGATRLLQAISAELPAAYTSLFVGPAADSTRTAVVRSVPVVDSAGRTVGTVSAATRLDRLPRLERRDLPAGSTIMVLDDAGRVLAHSPDYETWVGRDLSDQPYVRDALRLHQGSAEVLSADGVSRLAAYTTATRAPWVVMVGLPSEIVLGSSRVALLRNLWLGVLALGAATVVAWLVAGRLAEPLRRLAADASALGRGDLSRRTPADRQDELGVLGRVFNQMAEDVERHIGDLHASQSREQQARMAAEAAARELAEREQRLQELVRQLQVAQEEERRRVAYEIHDGLAQVAASAHQHLQTFADYHMPTSPADRESLERTVQLVQRTVREARRVIAGLRPTALDDFGLGTAIRLEIEGLREEGWQVSYDEDLGDRRLPSPIETAIFRVAQEALTNIRKHAGRTQVAVTLEHHADGVRLEVRDWGRGFNPQATRDRPRAGERVGLLSMQERVALLGGKCTVTSTPGGGTQVLAMVPLPAP